MVQQPRLCTAVSVKQPFANWIREGRKTIETRTWSTAYRGPLLIVSSRRPTIEPAGYALALVNLVDCRPMAAGDWPAACCDPYAGAFGWFLENIRPLAEPFEVRGQLGLYQVALPLTCNFRC